MICGTFQLWPSSSKNTSVRPSLCRPFHPSVTPFYASAFRHQRHYVVGFSVGPSEARNTFFPPVHGSVGPVVCLSREVSGHFQENAWREWLEILHADVSWPSSELIRLRSESDNFSFWHHLNLVKRAFPREHMEGMAWNFACWCILTTFRTDLMNHSLLIFSCDQAALWMVQRWPAGQPSVRLSHLFLIMFPWSYHHGIFRNYYQWHKWCPSERSGSEIKS